jgi:hypothetical protein
VSLEILQAASDLGSQDLGKINDLTLGIDGKNIYAATEAGVWRRSLIP